MKKILIWTVALVSCAACMDNTGYSEQFVDYATFEYIGEDYTHLFGSDSLFFNVEYIDENKGVSVIPWRHMGFYTKVSKDKNYLGGFILSYLKPANDTTVFKSNPYRVYDNYASGKNTYAVFRYDKDSDMMPEKDFLFHSAANGTCTLNGCAVANTEDVVKAVRSEFKEGDKLVLKATGYLKGEVSGTAEIALADYEKYRDSVVTRWTVFDISKLGSVDCIDFELSSTKPGIPEYFCMDSFSADISVSY